MKVRVMSPVVFFSLLFVVGCATVAPKPLVVTSEEQQIESAFNEGLNYAVSGDHASAYAVLSYGRYKFANSVSTIPEKYSALAKITGQKKANDLIRKLRAVYSTGSMKEAMHIARNAMEILQNEGLPIPHTLERIERKLRNGMQEMPFINFDSKFPPVDI